VGENFEKLTWDRESFFTAYPENHLGRPVGEVDINLKPEMKYREKLLHEWEKDTKGFYYFGLNEKLHYTNMVRALKENVFEYSLVTKNAKLKVSSSGNQACRFDKMNGENNLIINDQWDYNSLLWGNYMKGIKLENDIKGKVILSLN